MREIKFRRWCGITKAMLSDVDIENDTLRLLDGNNDQTYMQYTGLKDKNGKEIYEGDIVSFIYDGDSFEMIGVEKQVVEWKDHGWFPLNDSHTQFPLEVIGNIYSNPELLREI